MLIPDDRARDEACNLAVIAAMQVLPLHLQSNEVIEHALRFAWSKGSEFRLKEQIEKTQQRMRELGAKCAS